MSPGSEGFYTFYMRGWSVTLSGLNPKDWSLQVMELNLPRQNFLSRFTSPKRVKLESFLPPPSPTMPTSPPAYSVLLFFLLHHTIFPTWSLISLRMIHTVLCLPAPNCKLHESRHPLIGNRGPQPQHRQHLGLDNSLLWEAVLCIIGHTEGSIPDPHQQDASSTPHPTCNS